MSAGSVWAAVTAAPVRLTFQPGAGLSPVSCAGPGTAYNPRKPAAAQHTDCSYTYLRPSTGQPGDVLPGVSHRDVARQLDGARAGPAAFSMRRWRFRWTSQFRSRKGRPW